MFCTQCGTTIVEGARFCAQCGAPVYEEGEARKAVGNVAVGNAATKEIAEIAATKNAADDATAGNGAADEPTRIAAGIAVEDMPTVTVVESATAPNDPADDGASRSSGPSTIADGTCTPSAASSGAGESGTPIAANATSTANEPADPKAKRAKAGLSKAALAAIAGAAMALVVAVAVVIGTPGGSPQTTSSESGQQGAEASSAATKAEPEADSSDSPEGASGPSATAASGADASSSAAATDASAIPQTNASGSSEGASPSASSAVSQDAAAQSTASSSAASASEERLSKFTQEELDGFASIEGWWFKSNLPNIVSYYYIHDGVFHEFDPDGAYRGVFFTIEPGGIVYEENGLPTAGSGALTSSPGYFIPGLVLDQEKDGCYASEGVNGSGWRLIFDAYLDQENSGGGGGIVLTDAPEWADDVVAELDDGTASASDGVEGAAAGDASDGSASAAAKTAERTALERAIDQVDGWWHTVGQSQAVYHHFIGEKDYIYYSDPEDEALYHVHGSVRVYDATAFEPGDLPLSSEGAGGLDIEFNNCHYRMYDDDPDTLHCYGQDNASYSGTSSLVRTEDVPDEVLALAEETE